MTEQDKQKAMQLVRYSLPSTHATEGGTMTDAPLAADLDPVDVFIGPDLTSTTVFVVDQVKEDGITYDESKAVIGCGSKEQAKQLYLSNYPQGWICGPIQEFTTDEFKRWLGNPAHTRVRAARTTVNEDWRPFRTRRHTIGAIDEHGDRLYGKEADRALSGQADETTELPEHLKGLRIPPAWTDVRVNYDPTAARVATGVDAKGRKQTIYSDSHNAKVAAAKFERISKLQREFPAIYRRIKRDVDKGNEAAAAMLLIALTGIRPGSDADTGADKKAYGATTLLGKHVVEQDGKLRLQFDSKKGGFTDIPIDDKRLLSMLRERAIGDDDRLFRVSAASLRRYVRTLGDGSFLVKDFRTRLGTKIAADHVATTTCCADDKEYKRRVKEVATKVSQQLANTPTVALQAYINPTVFSKWRPA